MPKFDLTKENPAAQDNALINVLATAAGTEGWAVFVSNDGETIHVIAGKVTAELRQEIRKALRGLDDAK